MNPQHIAPQFSLFAYGNKLPRRLAGRASHQAKFISFGIRGTRIRRGSHAESLLLFVEHFLLRLVFVMYGQNSDHISYMLAWNIGHDPGKEGA